MFDDHVVKRVAFQLPRQAWPSWRQAWHHDSVHLDIRFYIKKNLEKVLTIWRGGRDPNCFQDLTHVWKISSLLFIK